MLFHPLFILIEPLLEVQNQPKHYKINDKVTCNLALELKYGASVEVVPMDRVSNVDFNEVSEKQRDSGTSLLKSSQGEFNRFKLTWEAARMKLPTKRELGKKCAQITKLINQPMTEVRTASLCGLSVHAQP